MPWVILVAGDPTRYQEASADARRHAEDPQRLSAQSRSLTSIAKACCLVETGAEHAWASLTRDLWPSNIFSHAKGRPVIDGVRSCLQAIAERDGNADLILIPVNHCAVDEASWLASTRGALRLGFLNRQTVYMLHDKPANDPRVALEKPEICTSSVMVGSVSSLLKLCDGSTEGAVVDLMVEDDRDPPAEVAGAAAGDAQNVSLQVVHIRLVEEYARLSANPRVQAARVIDCRV